MSMIDFQDLFNSAFSVVLILIGWGVRAIFEAITRLQNEQTKLERLVSTTYVRRDDYKEDMAEVKTLLGAIWKKIDNKEDKKP